MHIGIISPEFPPDIGGVEKYAYEYSKALYNLGHKVTVFTSQNKKDHQYTFPFKVMPILRMRRRLDISELTNYPVDAWHSMNAAYAWIAQYSDKPTVVSVHGNDFLRPYQNIERLDLERFPFLWRFKKQLDPIDKKLGIYLTEKSLKKALFSAKRILTNSCYTEDVFLQQFPECKGKTIPALVGLGEDFFNIQHIKHSEDEPKRLITLSRLSEPRKNIDLILKALARIKDRFSFTYTIIGDGYLRTELEQLSLDLGLSNRVFFKGFLADEALKTELASSDLFVLTSSILPTSHEGFGIVYLEAAASGTPVLAAKLAGAAEAVKEGVSGFFVKSPELNEIEDALIQFLEKRIGFDQRLCQEFAYSFKWQDVVDKAMPYYVSNKNIS